MSNIYEQVADDVVTGMTDSYELEDEGFLSKMRSLVVDAVKKHGLVLPTDVKPKRQVTRVKKTVSDDVVASGDTKDTVEKKSKGKRTKKAKRSGPAKRNGYTFFLQAEMQTEACKALPHGERMKHCGDVWKTLSDEDRQPWKTKADEYNATLDVPVDDSVTQADGSVA